MIPFCFQSQQGDLYNSKPAEDSHSQMSGDTGDSGRGGSVSDGHSNMGISHDAGIVGVYSFAFYM